MALYKLTAVNWRATADISTSCPTSARFFQAFWLYRPDTTTQVTDGSISTDDSISDEYLIAESRAGALSSRIRYESDTVAGFNNGNIGDGNSTGWFHFAMAIPPLDGSTGVGLRFWWNGTEASASTGDVANDSAKHWRYLRTGRALGGANLFGKIAYKCVATGLTTGQETSLVAALQTTAPGGITEVAHAWNLISDLTPAKGGVTMTETDGTATFDADDPLAGLGGSARRRQVIRIGI